MTRFACPLVVAVASLALTIGACSDDGASEPSDTTAILVNDAPAAPAWNAVAYFDYVEGDVVVVDRTGAVLRRFAAVVVNLSTQELTSVRLDDGFTPEDRISLRVEPTSAPSGVVALYDFPYQTFVFDVTRPADSIYVSGRATDITDDRILTVGRSEARTYDGLTLFDRSGRLVWTDREDRYVNGVILDADHVMAFGDGELHLVDVRTDERIVLRRLEMPSHLEWLGGRSTIALADDHIVTVLDRDGVVLSSPARPDASSPSSARRCLHVSDFFSAIVIDADTGTTLGTVQERPDLVSADGCTGVSTQALNVTRAGSVVDVGAPSAIKALAADATAIVTVDVSATSGQIQFLDGVTPPIPLPDVPSWAAFVTV